MNAKTTKRVGIGLFLGLAVLLFSGEGLLESYGDGLDSFSAARDMAQDIAIDPEGNVYVTGYGFSPESHFDFLTLKYDSEGNLIWERRYNGPANGSDYGQALALDSEGSVYVVGHSNGIGTSMDATIVKYGLDGRLLWAKRYGP